MLELFLLTTWLSAVRQALRHRAPFAIAVGACVGYLLLADTAAALATNRGDQNVFAFFNLALLGPGAGILRAPGPLPLPAWLLDHPLAVRGVRSALCAIVATHYLRRSADMHPLLERTAKLEAIAMPFVGASIIDAVAGIVLVFGWLLLRNDGGLI